LARHLQCPLLSEREVAGLKKYPDCTWKNRLYVFKGNVKKQKMKSEALACCKIKGEKKNGCWKDDKKIMDLLASLK